MQNLMHCWPTQWLESAANAGLAIYKGNGEWQFLNDGMRDLLGRFAQDIVSHAVNIERESCAEIAEGATAYTQFQTMEHYKLSAVIAGAIRERSNVEFSGGAPLHGAASAGTQGYACDDKGEKK